MTSSMNSNASRSWLDPKGRATALVLLGILQLSFVLSVYCYTGYFGTDDQTYLRGIRAVVGETTLHPEDFGAIRLGVTAPAALAYWLSDGSIFATIASFLVYPPLLALLAYFVGQRLHSVATGLLAAFLIATCPLIYQEGGAILPDNPMTFWAALSVLSMVKVILNGHSDRASWKWQALGAAASGMLLGGAYMCKESALILGVPLGLGLLFVRPRFRVFHVLLCGFMFALGLAMVLALEAVWLHHLTGQWFLRILTSQGEQVLRQFRARAEQQGTALGARLETFWGVLRRRLDATSLVLMPVFFVLYLFTRPAHAGGKKASWMLLTACLWPALYLTFGSATWREFQFPSIKERYYTLCMVPAAVMVAQVFAAVANRVAGGKGFLRVLRCSIAVLILAVPSSLWAMQRLQATYWHVGRSHGAPRMKAFFYALAKAREAHPKLPIVLSQSLTEMMSAIVAPKDLRRSIWLTPTGVEYRGRHLRGKPFVLLAPTEEVYIRRDKTLAEVRQLEKEGILTVVPDPLACCPAGRLDEMREYLFPLLSTTSAPRISREKKVATIAYVVTWAEPSSQTAATRPATAPAASRPTSAGATSRPASRSAR